MLLEFQRAFREALLDPSGTAVPAGLAAPGADRLVIHRHNFYHSLVEVMGAAYPAVRFLLGEPGFERAAADFVRGNPIYRPQLLAYGGGFAALLRNRPLPRPDLPALARLEWVHCAVQFAADAEPLTADGLGRVPHHDLPGLHLGLSPAARLLRLGYDVRGVRADALAGVHAEVLACPSRLLVVRSGFAVTETALSTGGYVLLASFARRRTLADAAERAIRADPAFDLAHVLAENIRRGVLVHRRVRVALQA